MLALNETKTDKLDVNTTPSLMKLSKQMAAEFNQNRPVLRACPAPATDNPTPPLTQTLNHLFTLKPVNLTHPATCKVECGYQCDVGLVNAAHTCTTSCEIVVKTDNEVYSPASCTGLFNPVSNANEQQSDLSMGPGNPTPCSQV